LSAHGGAPDLPDLTAIRAARERIARFVRVTPVLTSPSLDQALGARLYLKCENMQHVGAFKARGACNAVQSLPADVARRGVVTHSSGNHGAALAWAAQQRGIPAHVVMPENAPGVKVANVESFAGKVHFCAPSVPAREAMCAQVLLSTGGVLVHPYDDPLVIAGQGTATLELLEAHPDLDAVVAPVGGGGLLSGTSIAAHALNPRIEVYGAEPSGADDAARGFASGRVEPMPNPQTIADGLRSTLSERTLRALRDNVKAIATCSEGAIVAAMRLVWERARIVIEPSSAVPLAAMLEGTLDLAGRRVGIVLTGGNVDLDRLPWQR
jgi:threonine dehydratase